MTIRQLMPKTEVIKYPPTFDGELHIKMTPKAGSSDKIIAYDIELSHTTHNGELDSWQVLVEMAHAIIAQDRRRK